jgi:hypothetical protein
MKYNEQFNRIGELEEVDSFQLSDLLVVIVSVLLIAVFTLGVLS